MISIKTKNETPMTTVAPSPTKGATIITNDFLGLKGKKHSN